MNAKPELLSEARTVRENVRSSVQERLDALIEQYESACKISRGPNVQRALHWTNQAHDLELDLAKLVARHRDAVADCYRPTVAEAVCADLEDDNNLETSVPS